MAAGSNKGVFYFRICYQCVHSESTYLFYFFGFLYLILHRVGDTVGFMQKA